MENTEEIKPHKILVVDSNQCEIKGDLCGRFDFKDFTAILIKQEDGSFYCGSMDNKLHSDFIKTIPTEFKPNHVFSILEYLGYVDKAGRPIKCTECDSDNLEVKILGTEGGIPSEHTMMCQECETDIGFCYHGHWQQ